jgi:hypothetical protein
MRSNIQDEENQNLLEKNQNPRGKNLEDLEAYLKRVVRRCNIQNLENQNLLGRNQKEENQKRKILKSLLHKIIDTNKLQIKDRRRDLIHQTINHRILVNTI